LTNDISYCISGGNRINFVITQVFWQIYQFTKPVPEFLLKSGAGQYTLILRWIELIARRAAGEGICSIFWPNACDSPLADRPIGQCEQMIGHGDVQVAAFVRLHAGNDGQQNIDYCGICAPCYVGY